MATGSLFTQWHLGSHSNAISILPFISPTNSLLRALSSHSSTPRLSPCSHPFSHLSSNGFDVRYAQVSDWLPLDFDRSLNRDKYTESLVNKMPPFTPRNSYSSVVYVSFGSYAHASKAQIREMAMGLLESKQSFVWALRPDIVASDVTDILPGGFLDEIKEQGVVVPWASQLQVLSHPSVGGFLSHCGWNSILESIWLGIPMLAFPLLTDQYTNCKLITEEWRVAIRLGGSSRSINNSRALVGRDVIGRNVKELMGGRGGREARRRVESMRDVLQTAAMKRGSSYENLGQPRGYQFDIVFFNLSSYLG